MLYMGKVFWMENFFYVKIFSVFMDTVLVFRIAEIGENSLTFKLIFTEN